MAEREENNQETSVAVMDKKLKLQGAIVEISSEEKLNAITFNTKDKSVHFEGVKQKPDNLPDPKNKIDGKGSYTTKKGKLHLKGKQKYLGSI